MFDGAHDHALRVHIIKKKDFFYKQENCPIGPAIGKNYFKKTPVKRWQLLEEQI